MWSITACRRTQHGSSQFSKSHLILIDGDSLYFAISENRNVAHGPANTATAVQNLTPWSNLDTAIASRDSATAKYGAQRGWCKCLDDYHPHTNSAQYWLHLTEHDKCRGKRNGTENCQRGNLQNCERGRNEVGVRQKLDTIRTNKSCD